MAALVETMARLEAVLDSLDDVGSQDQVAKSLTEISSAIDRHRNRAEHIGTGFTDPDLPEVAGAAITPERWQMSLDKLEELQSAIAASPATVRDGQLWTKSKSSTEALLSDMSQSVRERWDALIDDLPSRDVGFTIALPPNAAGVDELRDAASQLDALAAKEDPEPGDPKRSKNLTTQIRELRGKLEEQAVPTAIRADWEVLLDGRLALEKYGGELERFVEERGLAGKIVVSLRHD